MGKNLRKGFSLIEIIVTLVIVGLLAVVALPNYMLYKETAGAQAAENNLFAIAAAQQKFAEDYTSLYCINTGANPTGKTPECGDSASDLDANLFLHLSPGDPFFASYACCANGTASCGTAAVACAGAATSLYCCTATDGKDTLILQADSAAGNTITCTPAGNNCP